MLKLSLTEIYVMAEDYCNSRPALRSAGRQSTLYNFVFISIEDINEPCELPQLQTKSIAV